MVVTIFKVKLLVLFCLQGSGTILKLKNSLYLTLATTLDCKGETGILRKQLQIDLYQLCHLFLGV